MDDTAPTHPEPLFLLWLLGVAMALLACHVALGYVRHARRHESRAAVAATAAAAVALGTGFYSVMVFTVASMPMAYDLGYNAAALGGLWVLACAVGVLPATLMAWRPAPATALLGGALFGLGATAVAAGLLFAAGPLPGLVWRAAPLVLAVLIIGGGAAAALWLSQLGPGRAGRHRRRWRALAAAVMAGALVAGLELVQSAGDLATQIGSAYSGELAASSLTLATVLVAPPLLALLAGVLHLGPQPGADEDGAPVPAVRRRHRRRRSLWRRLFP